MPGEDLDAHIKLLSNLLAGALGEHVSRTHSRIPSVPIEVALEAHVLAVRDAIHAGARGAFRPDGGARLLARLSTSAAHAADDIRYMQDR